jgi:hypothetical protein
MPSQAASPLLGPPGYGPQLGTEAFWFLAGRASLQHAPRFHHPNARRFGLSALRTRDPPPHVPREQGRKRSLSPAHARHVSASHPVYSAKSIAEKPLRSFRRSVPAGCSSLSTGLRSIRGTCRHSQQSMHNPSCLPAHPSRHTVLPSIGVRTPGPSPCRGMGGARGVPHRVGPRAGGPPWKKTLLDCRPKGWPASRFPRHTSQQRPLSLCGGGSWHEETNTAAPTTRTAAYPYPRQSPAESYARTVSLTNTARASMMPAADPTGQTHRPLPPNHTGSHGNSPPGRGAFNAATPAFPLRRRPEFSDTFARKNEKVAIQVESDTPPLDTADDIR